MKKCACGGTMEERKAKTAEGFSYSYYKCPKCGEEFADLKQLQDMADKYRNLNSYTATLSKWGQSIGLRIPKELVDKYGLKDSAKVTIIPEKEGVRILFRNEK